MTIKSNSFIAAGAVVIALLICFGFSLRASAINSVPTEQPFTYKPGPTINATTTNATSSAFLVKGAKRIAVQVGRGDTTGQGNAGQSNFRVQATWDGVNWFEFPKLILASSTSQTTVASIFLSGTSTSAASIDLRVDGLYATRCIIVETTDGEHTCSMFAEF